MAYLLDANVLSESSRKRPDSNVLRWLAENDSQLHVSALALGEIIKGIHLMNHGKRRSKIETWFARIERWADGRIVAIDLATARTWGQFYASHQRSGRKLPLIDSVMAATALHHQLTLVTRNSRDFPDDVPVLNPWDRSG